MKKKDIIKKWLDNDQLTNEESKAFKNLDAYDSYMKIAYTAKKFKASEYNIDEGYANLNIALEHRKKPVVSIFSKSTFLRIAAIFIVIIGSYFTFFSTMHTSISVAASQKKLIKLPDHTSVELNALSTVKYQKEDWESNRKVSLKGEAYFKVSKGKKFDIQTDTGIISVLGTQFNVKSRKDYFEVVCYEGLVSVTHQKNKIMLPAGKVFRVIQGHITTTSTTKTKPEWIEGRSTFKSTAYQYILKEFERQYNVTILAKNIDQNQLFTGNFVHSDIQTAIQSITIPLRLKYMIKDNTITLYRSDQNQN